MIEPLSTMHLFAGAGGGLLADLILGHKPVVAVEWEPYACQVLRERAADGWFPGLSVWEGDVRLFDPSEYAGRVDCIHAGFPCQDISLAGKQAGVEDGTRSGLYREVLRIADIVRPRYLFLENVAAILSNGLGTVLGDLAARGYDVRWTCLRASDVGANHRRDRWWALATLDANTNLQSRSAEPRQQQQGPAQSPGSGKDRLETRNDVAVAISQRSATGAPNESRRAVRNQHGDGAQEEREWVELEPGTTGSGENVADPESTRTGNERENDRKGCDEINSPDNTGGAIGWNDRQIDREDVGNADSLNWWAGTGRCDGAKADDSSWWATEPDVGRVVNGLAATLDGGSDFAAESTNKKQAAARAHRLRAIGNGQVPLQAAVAWRLLAGES